MKSARLTKSISATMAILIVLLSGCGQAAGAPAPKKQEAITAETATSAMPAAEAAEQVSETTAESTEQHVLPAEKAEYLNYKFAYTITPDNLCESFAETVRRESTESFSREEGDTNVAQLCEEWVYTGEKPSEFNSGAAFLVWSADNCGLIDAGTFPRSSCLDDVYAHLTETNGLPISALGGATQLCGNSYTAEIGDILFWFNDEGAAVNAGVVTKSHGLSITVAICSTDGKVASFTLDNTDRDTNVVSRCTLVQMTYTSNEQLVFLFLVNDMKYTVAAACGAMANIYCESLFNPNVEEHSFSEGYGLCQWTGQRRISFEMWCATNGLDHSKLKSQLLFMQYELENDVCGDLDYRLRTCGNTEQDAYNAGAIWCELYENPTGVNELTKVRGEFARDSFFPAYKGHPYM